MHTNNTSRSLKTTVYLTKQLIWNRSCLLLLLIALIMSATRAYAQCQPPSTPTGITAVPGKAKITISWGASSNVISYTVLRSVTGASGSFNPLAADLTNTIYDDTHVNNGETYYYSVYEVGCGGMSETSSVVSTPINLGPVTGLRAARNNGQVNVSWGALADAGWYSHLRSTCTSAMTASGGATR